MRFERVSRELYAKPWAITASAYQAFHDVFQRHLQGIPMDKTIEVMGVKVEYKTPDEYDVIDGVAVIEIEGALGYRLDEIEKACMGGVDYVDIRKAFAKAEADPDITSILMVINSPGGMVTGLEETAEYIKSIEKPVVSFTDNLVASAGYYLASAADSIFATASSQVGCIGTLMTWIDVTKAMEREGLEREMIASGKYKGMMFPGIPLTDEQRELLQDEVDMLADEFKSWVIDNRGNVSKDVMEGQTLFGKYALSENLIDEIGDINQALTEAREMGTEL
jgi:signal peptide peptidase SppA